MSLNMDLVACIVLGGGQGTRLSPLTEERCKPGVPFGGRYRLVDVPISNSLNSNIHKIYIITQFLSANLHRHILDTYRLSYPSQGFIELLAAEQRPDRKTWFEGTADAVRKNLHYFEETDVEYFLILSGDQLYSLNFQDMIEHARRNEADLTVACLPVAEQNAKRMGVMKVNEKMDILDFYEKPKEEHVLKEFRLSNKDPIFQHKAFDLKGKYSFLGSMGIYVFKREALFKLLEEDQREDFGSHLIPTQVNKGKTSAYLYNGYWEDIGTIESYYNANISLTQDNPGLNCYDEVNSIYTRTYHLPGPKISKTRIQHSIICEGAIVNAKEVNNSILGTRAVVDEGSVIKNSYIVGNDFYQRPKNHKAQLPRSMSVGKNCKLNKVILDRNVCLGDEVCLLNEDKKENFDAEHGIVIRNGIIVVPQGTCVPSGYTL